MEHRDRDVRPPDGERRHHLVWTGFHELAKEADDVVEALDRVADRPVRDRAVERVQAELEGRNDAEVRARSAEAPEELGLLVFARGDQAAVRGDELDRAQVVDRKAVATLEPSHAAAEREPGDAGMRDDADGTHEPGRL